MPELGHFQHAEKLKALAPEDVLRAVFTQAFAGEAIRLPEGATVATLRAALALEPETTRRIFNEVKAARTDSRLAAAGSRRDGGHGVALTATVAISIGVAAIAAAVGYRILGFDQHPSLPPAETAQLYAAAVADKSAFTALENRAGASDAAAQFDLGTLFDSNLLSHETSVAKNDAVAFQWYQAAASAGFAAAENNLGFDYKTGHGVARNDVLAAEWYRRAADSGLANAQNSLGFLYQNGLGVPHDDARAVLWYQKAAAQGLAIAQNNLAAAYEAGRGTAQDFAEAAMWFGRAAAQGEPNAENSLGFLYYRGLGVPNDTTQSFKWFSRAAAGGNAPAQVNLGLSYAAGEGTAPDDVSAVKWLLLANERGDKDAAGALALVTPKLTDEQLAAAKRAAADWDAKRRAQ